MRRVLIIAAVTAASLIAAMYVAGLSMPERHLASAQRLIQLDVISVAARIRTVTSYSEWQSGVSVSAIQRDGDATLYTETRDGRDVRYSLAEVEPDRRFVATIVDPNLPFGGSWTILLEPQEAGTQVLIVESGVIRNPFFRVLSAYVFGRTARMTEFLDALEALGQARA